MGCRVGWRGQTEVRREDERAERASKLVAPSVLQDQGAEVKDGKREHPVHMFRGW